jgi:hypothetical protein
MIASKYSSLRMPRPTHAAGVIVTLCCSKDKCDTAAEKGGNCVAVQL